MNISDILSPERISCAASPASKKRALEEIGALMLNADASLTQGEIFDSLLSRERLGSTGLGHGVAIPHGKFHGIRQPIISFGRSLKGLDFESMDGQPVHLFFLLIAPENSANVHLKALARIAKILKNSSFLKISSIITGLFTILLLVPLVWFLIKRFHLAGSLEKIKLITAKYGLSGETMNDIVHNITCLKEDYKKIEKERNDLEKELEIRERESKDINIKIPEKEMYVIEKEKVIEDMGRISQKSLKK